MSGHFSAFSLVDRITRARVGQARREVASRSRRTCPLSVHVWLRKRRVSWPPGIAMAQLDFRLRPVAGLAARHAVRHRGAAGAEARTSRRRSSNCDNGRRRATAAGVRRRRFGSWSSTTASGPMLPMEEFRFTAGDARALRAAVRTGRTERAVSRRAASTTLEIVELVPDERCARCCCVPQEAAFFTDHFPRRPVFPGTLLLDAQIASGAEVRRRVAALAAWARARLPRVVPEHEDARRSFRPARCSSCRIDFASTRTNRMSARRRPAYVLNGKRSRVGMLEIAVRS